MGLLQYILSFFSLLYIFLPDPSFSSLIISSAMSNLMLRPETEFLNSVTVIVKFESQFWFSESFPFVKYIFQQVTFASNTSSIPLICWYTSDTSGSGSVFFFFFSWSCLLLHPLLLFWLHVGHYVWKTLEVLSDAVFSRVSSDTDLQWGQSCLFTQGLRDLRLGVPCKLSFSSLHPPFPPSPGRSFPASPSGSLGCLPGPPSSQQVLKPTICLLSTTRWQIVLNQFGQSVGYIFWYPNWFSRPAHKFLSSQPKEPSRAVLSSPLCLTFSLPFLRRVGFVQMAQGKEQASQSSVPSLGFPFVWNLGLWLPKDLFLNCI